MIGKKFVSLARVSGVESTIAVAAARMQAIRDGEAEIMDRRLKHVGKLIKRDFR